jgi:hypothetical protein
LYSVWNRKIAASIEQEWVVKMKNFTEQDQRITRDLEKYQLAPPSPDLHDRVLRAAREAMARGGDTELPWSVRWLTACRVFRQEILAFASALMLILGVVMQLGISQSALADSIERLSVISAVSGRLNKAISMDCTLLTKGAGSEYSKYRVRWNATGVTRTDMDLVDGTEQSLWIYKETVSARDDGTAVRTMAISDLPSTWYPPLEFLTPAILAQNIKERYGFMQAEHHDKDGLLLIGRGNREVIEISIDSKEYLPTMIKKYLPDSPQEHLEEVRFQWNKPLPHRLLVPGSTEVKRQVN